MPHYPIRSHCAAVLRQAFACLRYALTLLHMTKPRQFDASLRHNIPRPSHGWALLTAAKAFLIHALAHPMRHKAHAFPSVADSHLTVALALPRTTIPCPTDALPILCGPVASPCLANPFPHSAVAMHRQPFQCQSVPFLCRCRASRGCAMPIPSLAYP